MHPSAIGGLVGRICGNDGHVMNLPWLDELPRGQRLRDGVLRRCQHTSCHSRYEGTAYEFSFDREIAEQCPVDGTNHGRAKRVIGTIVGQLADCLADPVSGTRNPGIHTWGALLAAWKRIRKMCLSRGGCSTSAGRISSHLLVP